MITASSDASRSSARTHPHPVVVLQNLPLASPPLFIEIGLRQYRGRERRHFSGDPARAREFLALPIHERAKFTLIHGLVHFGIDADLEPAARYITMLRDPIEAIIAFYYLVLASPTHHLHARLNADNWALIDLIENRRVEVDNPLVRMLNPLPERAVPFGAVTEAMLAAACERLESRYDFGLAERFAESLILLRATCGWSDLACRGRPLAVPTRLAASLPADARERLRELNRFDLALYRHASELFEQRFAALGPGHAAEVAEFLSANSGQPADTVIIGGEPVSIAPLQPDEQDRRDTVWLASYPRSGNTWLRFLLDSYVFPAARYMQDVGRLSGELDWWVQEAKRTGQPESWIVNGGRHVQRRHARPEGFPSNLFFKTHFVLTPEHPLLARSARAVYLLRDPRDVLLSGMNFAELTTGTHLESERQYALDFIRLGGDAGWMGMGYGTWAEHTQSWLGGGDFPVLCVRYEDLRADTQREFRRILEFLEFPIEEARMKRAIEYSSLPRLRNLEVASRATTDLADLKGGDRRFFHKGLSGQPLSHLGPDVEVAFREALAAPAARRGYRA